MDVDQRANHLKSCVFFIVYTYFLFIRMMIMFRSYFIYELTRGIPQALLSSLNKLSS